MKKRILVATRKGLFDLHNHAGAGWRVANTSFLGQPVSMVLRDPHDACLYAALDLGHFGVKLHRSDTNGKDWQEVSVPSYTDIDDEASLQLIWSMEVGQAGTLWAGTIPGGLFRSTDRGDSWQIVQSLWAEPLRKQWFGGGYDKPGIHSICVDPRNAQCITVGVSCGGVWVTEDEGDSWRVACNGLVADYMPPDQSANPATQDPHRVVQCRQQAESFWMQHHNGIFRSINGCETWQRIDATPSSFGFAVAVHPAQADTAWFVPAIKDDQRYPVDGKLVVTRTDDGGKTFKSLSNGLPETDSYDLIYRHSFDVDDSGDYLAMASTTGNLWISENGGKQWNIISNHLPPVYALRFISAND